ncbi:MAG TPA: hypothetical protein VGE93_22960, partial [Bryobacteraceae bacterium]
MNALPCAQQLQLLQSGDLGACAYFTAEHEGEILQYSMELCGDEDHAIELQTKVFQYMPVFCTEFTSCNYLRAWLYVIARLLHGHDVQKGRMDLSQMRDPEYVARQQEILSAELAYRSTQILLNSRKTILALTARRREAATLYYV